MGKRGPAREPKALKLAKGERRPSQVNYDEPDLPAPSSEEPPADLAGEGLEEWTRIVRSLIEHGVLTEPDLPAFADYCRRVTMLRAAEAKVKRVGLELAIAKGYMNASLKLQTQVSQLRQQLGLTPSSRTGVRAIKKQGVDAANPAARYLKALQGGKR